MSTRTLVLTDSKAQAQPQPWSKSGRLFWLGLVAAFGGAVIETIFMLLTRHQLMNRSGLLYGQLSLVWGLAAVLCTLFLSSRAQYGMPAVFLAGMVWGTVFEFACSLFQEKVLGMVFWDYSHLPFSIGGRVNLLFSVFWGCAATVWIFAILPRLDRLLEKFPRVLRRKATTLVAVLLVADLALTGCALRRMEARQTDTPPRGEWEEFLDQRYPDERLYRRFTNMAYVEDYVLEHPNFR